MLLSPIWYLKHFEKIFENRCDLIWTHHTLHFWLMPFFSSGWSPAMYMYNLLQTNKVYACKGWRRPIISTSDNLRRHVHIRWHTYVNDTSKGLCVIYWTIICCGFSRTWKLGCFFFILLITLHVCAKVCKKISIFRNPCQILPMCFPIWVSGNTKAAAYLGYFS